MPDTKTNQIAYPQQSTQQAGLGFTITRMVVIICFSTGVALDVALSKSQGKGASEHSLMRELIDSFKLGDIFLADRYYSNYFLISALQEEQVDIVFQQHAVQKTDCRKESDKVHYINDNPLKKMIFSARIMISLKYFQELISNHP